MDGESLEPRRAHDRWFDWNNPDRLPPANYQRAARHRFGTALPLHGVPIYTDARHYTAAGVPTVLYGAGPRTLAEANGHRADERLRLDDLARATDVVALALAELLAPRQKAR